MVIPSLFPSLNCLELLKKHFTKTKLDQIPSSNIENNEQYQYQCEAFHTMGIFGVASKRNDIDYLTEANTYYYRYYSTIRQTIA